AITASTCSTRWKHLWPACKENVGDSSLGRGANGAGITERSRPVRKLVVEKVEGAGQFSALDRYCYKGRKLLC
ncbi:MAG TPA: hypothetical protein VID30_01995, partial [Bradyrhizobium sp.]